jgi:hypothetical protein
VHLHEDRAAVVQAELDQLSRSVSCLVVAADCLREYGVRPFGKFAATGRIRGGSAGHPRAGS